MYRLNRPNDTTLDYVDVYIKQTNKTILYYVDVYIKQTKRTPHGIM